MSGLRRGGFFILALVLSGCVDSRDLIQTPLRQSGDHQLTCKQVAMEYRTNTEVAMQKISLNNEDDGHDVLLGFLIWPGLADFKNADGLEGNALLDRNVWLREVAKSKNCDTLEYPRQPARYD